MLQKLEGSEGSRMCISGRNITVQRGILLEKDTTTTENLRRRTEK